MSSDTTAGVKRYRFSRLRTAIMWDPILKQKLVVTQEDYTSHDFEETLGTDTTDNDFPLKAVEFGYWPQKGAFFYFSKGYVFFKQDPAAYTIDTCGVEFENFCDRSSDISHCERDEPLFKGTWDTATQSWIDKDQATLNHHSMVVSSNTADDNYAITFDVVFDSIFVVFENEDQRIYRIGRHDNDTDWTNFASSTFFDFSNIAGTSSYDTAEGFTGPNTISGRIENICSMDFFGLFLGVNGANKVVRLEIDIDNDDAVDPLQYFEDGSTTATNQRIRFADTLYNEMADPAGEFRLLQTKSYFARHRPCYYVTKAAPHTLYRLTTRATLFFPTDGSTPEIDLFTTDWSEGNLH